MPIAGFKKGDEVLTPAGREATVLDVRRVRGRERVTVRLAALDVRTFDAAALRRVQRR